ncbi:hypothetical protein VISI1226_14871 [Vibrio sinaloensis DSM 21326]|uniref:Lipoprotein n=1 Tax=Vibrio sinaloensis DSM 21326 TaxID=945550 RepID=E8M9Z9_PHOS4|nr:hypothetical protein [Vibrio sinaloensis]EGA69192.1 hypothetical protein VISI1226_14871 [Vibrio sinaloensis DSM 21326]
MKAAKSALLLTLPALMAGCGGGSGGSSGSSSPSPTLTSYTWQFVQMKELPKSAMEQFCGVGNATVFNLDDSDSDSSNWLYTFAAKAPNISDVFVYNSDGSLANSSLDKFDVNQINGTLTFSENDVPDGGYLVIVDSSNGIDNVLSVEKEAIQSFIVKINREQGQQTCLTNGSLVNESQLKKVNIGTFNGVSTTAVEGYVDGKSPQDSGTIKANIEVIATNENLLLSGYNTSNEIVGYKFINKSELSDNSSSAPNTVFLDAIFDNKTIDFTNTVGAVFGSLTMKAIYSGFTFDWYDWTTESNSFSTSAPASPSVGYSSSYEGTLNGWNVNNNYLLENVANNVNLTTLDMPTQPISLNCSGANCYFSETEVTSLNSELNTIRFSSGDARYTLVSTGNALVPKVVNVTYPDSNTVITSQMLLSENSNLELRKAFLVNGTTRNYTPSTDYIDLLATPIDDLQHRRTMVSYDYTLISK